ncbi:MAG: retention module-containing protein, partial [Desulfobacterales bacterium]|nr:retention module-containing protein [Desulfobacterales bacterium]
MAQAGTIKTITGNVNARTPDGQVRQLMAGDMVYENETIETAAGSELAIELNDGRTLNLAENSQVVIDETVVEAVAPQDAVVAEVRELQAALEAGEEIPDEETAAGEEDAGHNYDLAYYAGDQSGGQVDSYLFGTGYGDEDEDFPDIEGEEEPEAAVVPAPEPEPTPVFIVGSPDDDDGTLGTDYHTVNPGGDVQGEILGQDGADVLAGDPGSVTPVSNNYILILDYSGSITDGDPDLDENVSLDEDFSSLINKTVETIEKLGSNVQDSADGYEVKINLLPFAGNADGINSAWISFTNQDGTVNIEYNLGGNTGTGTIDDIDAIIGEISGWMTSTAFSLIGDVDDTNYYAAFEQAQYLVDTDYDQNGVIFISDGAVNAGGAYMGTDASPYDVLKEMVDSIQAIGITITESDRTAETINNIAE